MPHRHGRTLFQQVLALAATRPIFNGNLFVVDGGSGKMRAAADYNGFADTHWLDQSNTTKQCALPAGHADYAGGMCWSMVGAFEYVSTRAAAYWSLQHTTGVEYDLTTALSAVTQVTWETTDAFLGPYLQRYWSAGAPHLAQRPQNSPVAPTDLAVGSASTGTPRVGRMRHDATTLYAKITGVSETSGALAAAPGAAPSSRGLGLGRVTLPSNFRAAYLMMFPFLDAVGLATVDQYTQQTYGVAT